MGKVRIPHNVPSSFAKLGLPGGPSLPGFTGVPAQADLMKATLTLRSPGNPDLVLGQVSGPPQAGVPLDIPISGIRIPANFKPGKGDLILSISSLGKTILSKDIGDMLLKAKTADVSQYLTEARVLYQMMYATQFSLGKTVSAAKLVARSAVIAKYGPVNGNLLIPLIEAALAAPSAPSVGIPSLNNFGTPSLNLLGKGAIASANIGDTLTGNLTIPYPGPTFTSPASIIVSLKSRSTGAKVNIGQASPSLKQGVPITLPLSAALNASTFQPGTYDVMLNIAFAGQTIREMDIGDLNIALPDASRYLTEARALYTAMYATQLTVTKSVNVARTTARQALIAKYGQVMGYSLITMIEGAAPAAAPAALPGFPGLTLPAGLSANTPLSGGQTLQQVMAQLPTKAPALSTNMISQVQNFISRLQGASDVNALNQISTDLGKTGLPSVVLQPIRDAISFKRNAFQYTTPFTTTYPPDVSKMFTGQKGKISINKPAFLRATNFDLIGEEKGISLLRGVTGIPQPPVGVKITDIADSGYITPGGKIVITWQVTTGKPLPDASSIINLVGAPGGIDAGQLKFLTGKGLNPTQATQILSQLK